MFERNWKKKRASVVKKSGFTLLEVLSASVIMGIGFVSILASVTASTKTSFASADMTQAIFLTQEIREWTTNLPFSDPDIADAGNPPGPDSYAQAGEYYVDDLDDLMGAYFSPPKNGLGENIEGMDGWSQAVNLTWGSPDDINTAVVPGTSGIVQVQVTISKNYETIMQTSWLVTENGDD